MESMKLTFLALDAKIEALPKAPSIEAILSKKTTWGFAFAAVGALVGLLSVKLLPGNALYTEVIACIGLAVEVAGLAVAGITQIPKKWPTSAGERREAAERLDFDLPHHVALVEWLRTFPLDQRQALLEFVSDRHGRLQEKLPMLTGAVEKLGALPVVIALYLQFKDTHWPPHPSWAEILLMFLLVLVYWLSIMQISVRLRYQLYETLLAKAIA
jgi:hypothetical protein